jgi:hypothetical protein
MMLLVGYVPGMMRGNNAYRNMFRKCFGDNYTLVDLKGVGE